MTSEYVILSVDRFRALGHGMLWAACAALLGLLSFLVYANLHFVPSGVSNRIEDYAWATMFLPLPVLALYAWVKAGSRILLGLWPGEVGIFADDAALVFRLGPFGTRRFDAARLEIRYPFELLENGEDCGYEAYLPEEEQISRFLPRMRHPGAVSDLKQLILRFGKGTESESARRLRPLIDRWRLARISENDRTTKD